MKPARVEGIKQLLIKLFSTTDLESCDSHDLEYRIIGDDIQLVEIELDPMETVIAEAGTMMYMDSQISFETKMGDGSDPNQGLMGKLLSAGTRVLTGESLFVTHFTNQGGSKQRVAFAAPYPGKIIPIELAALGGTLIVQKDGFLCAAKGTKISITLNRRIGAGLVGGEGFILQKLEGDGKTFMHAGGTVIERRLNNESLENRYGLYRGPIRRALILISKHLEVFVPWSSEEKESSWLP